MLRILMSCVSNIINRRTETLMRVNKKTGWITFTVGLVTFIAAHFFYFKANDNRPNSHRLCVVAGGNLPPNLTLLKLNGQLFLCVSACVRSLATISIISRMKWMDAVYNWHKIFMNPLVADELFLAPAAGRNWTVQFAKPRAEHVSAIDRLCRVKDPSKGRNVIQMISSKCRLVSCTFFLY